MRIEDFTLLLSLFNEERERFIIARLNEYMASIPFPFCNSLEMNPPVHQAFLEYH